MTRPLRSFTLHTDSGGARRAVKVYVYATAAEMHAAAHRSTGEDFTDSEAVCHGWQDDGTPRATLRLTAEHTTDPVALHEVIHAAQWVYCADAIADGDLATDHFQPDNETFAHIVSDLWEGLTRAVQS